MAKNPARGAPQGAPSTEQNAPVIALSSDGASADDESNEGQQETDLDDESIDAELPADQEFPVLRRLINDTPARRDFAAADAHVDANSFSDVAIDSPDKLQKLISQISEINELNRYGDAIRLVAIPEPSETVGT